MEVSDGLMCDNIYIYIFFCSVETPSSGGFQPRFLSLLQGAVKLLHYNPLCWKCELRDKIQLEFSALARSFYLIRHF